MKLVKVISNVRVVYAIEIHGFRAFKANKLLEKWLGILPINTIYSSYRAINLGKHALKILVR